MSDKIDLENNKVIPVSGPTATSTKVTAEMIVGSVEIGDDGNSKVNYFVKFSTENSNHHILYPWEGLKSLVQSWISVEKEAQKNVEMLNDWKPFTVIPAGEFKNSKGEMEEFYHVVLQVPGFQTIEQFEGNLQECREECHELNVRIRASLSQHIMDENKKPGRVTMDPWSSLMGRKVS